MLLICLLNIFFMFRFWLLFLVCSGREEFFWVIDIIIILGVVGVRGIVVGIWFWGLFDMILIIVGVFEFMERGLLDCLLLLGLVCEVMTMNFCCFGVLGVLGWLFWMMEGVFGVRMLFWICFGVFGIFLMDEDCWMINWDRG